MRHSKQITLIPSLFKLTTIVELTIIWTFSFFSIAIFTQILAIEKSFTLFYTKKKITRFGEYFEITEVKIREGFFIHMVM